VGSSESMSRDLTTVPRVWVNKEFLCCSNGTKNFDIDLGNFAASLTSARPHSHVLISLGGSGGGKADQI